MGECVKMRSPDASPQWLVHPKMIKEMSLLSHHPHVVPSPF